MTARLVPFLRLLGLVASCLLLVTAQHRARSLFIDFDRAQQQARALEAEGNRLRVELGRAAQPGAIDTAARQLGLRPIDAARTIYFSGETAVPGK
jgi:cell division protein FtsL